MCSALSEFVTEIRKCNEDSIKPYYVLCVIDFYTTQIRKTGRKIVIIITCSKVVILLTKMC